MCTVDQEVLTVITGCLDLSTGVNKTLLYKLLKFSPTLPTHSQSAPKQKTTLLNSKCLTGKKNVWENKQSDTKINERPIGLAL